jgi:hypothetical protein
MWLFRRLFLVGLAIPRPASPVRLKMTKSEGWASWVRT